MNHPSIRRFSGRVSRKAFPVAICVVSYAVNALVSVCTAEDTFPISEDSYVRRISPTDGLLPGEIETVYQDSRGFMWFGAEKGLSRYDGFEFVNYVHDPTNINSITAGAAWCIKEDDKGNLWIGTGGGLNCYDRNLESFKQFVVELEPENGLYSNNIRSLQIEDDGTLWVGTLGESLHFFDPNAGTFQQFYFEGDEVERVRPVDFISVVTRDIHGRLWLGTQGSGVLWESAKRRFTPLRLTSGNREDQAKIHQAYVNDFLVNDDGTIIIATDKGVFQVEDAADQKIRFTVNPTFSEISQELENTRIHSLLRDVDGKIWFGTDGRGAFVFDPPTGQYRQLVKHPTRTSSLASNVIREIYEDRTGDLWFGHYPSGVSYISRANAGFRVIVQDPSKARGLTYSSVTGFEEDDKGNLWITTDGGGVNYWDRKQDTFTAYTPDDTSGLSAPGALTVELDRNRSLWVGTWAGGLNRLDPDATSFKTYLPDPSDPNSLSNPNVFSLLEDSYGTLWIGTMDGGLNRYRPDIDGFDRYYPNTNDPTSINSNQVWVLFEDRKQELWVGTNVGFNRYDRKNNRFASYMMPSVDGVRPSSQWVSAFFQDSNSHYWIGTLGGGLYEFLPEKGFIRQITEAEGLASNMVCGILEDEFKDLWISTYEGLTHLNPKSGRCTVYDESNGLPGRQFNRFTAIKRTRSGELLFGAVEGMLIVTPSLRETLSTPPPVILTRLQLNNKIVSPASPESPIPGSISEIEQMELDWGFSLLEIQFAALSYRVSERNSFTYRHEGIDQDWRKPGKSQSASYVSLDPGHYTFKVRAANNEGVWNAEGKSLAIIVHPPVWMEPWFKTLVGVLLVGGILGLGWTIAKTRMQKLVIKAEHERNLAEERENMRETLRQHQKMEAIGTLASGISHDFNNILTGLVLSVENLKDDAYVISRSKPEIDEIEQLTHRAQSLVRQILTFSRNEDIQTSPHDFVSVIKSGLSLLRATLPQSIQIVENFPAQPLVVMASETQLHQIILNLGSNAAQAMTSEKGTIRLTVERSVAPDVPTIPNALRGRPTARLRFEDNGSGMSIETTERMFDPFFTTKPREKGTGLGMAVVFGIVNSHGGHIAVSSTEGKGSVFTIHLPLELDRIPIKEHETRTDSLSPARNKCVMIVDDEVPIIRTLSRALKYRGFHVDGFSHSRKALEEFRSDPNRYDIVLSDYTMPDLNGLEMIEQMKRIRSDLKAVLMSGAADKSDQCETGTLRPDAWAAKPFKLDQLTKTLSDLTSCQEVSTQ